MNKSLAIFAIALTSTIFVSCSSEPTVPPIEEETPVVEETLTFTDDLFTLEMPAPFENDQSLLKPKTAGDFPEILFGLMTDVPKGTILEAETAIREVMCSETDSCGKITSSEAVTISGVEGLMFTVEYPGRSLEDKEGNHYEYYYSLPVNGDLLRFWTSASDLEEPEKAKESFEAILQTLVLK